MQFSDHFDRSLTYDSAYHQHMASLMTCVEKNKYLTEAAH
jgi:hypothetical protein